TSIIGVVLAGISLGNYLGGRIADRWPERRTLGVLLAAGGLASLAVLPLINIATAIPTGQLFDPSNPFGGALPLDRAVMLIARIVAITTIIFFPPSLILGMVSPVVIKLLLRDLAHSGGLVGKVYALSTLGSILGTFATGFVLIELMGTRLIVLGVGLVLLGLSVLCGDLVRVGARVAAPLAAGVLLVGLLVPARNVQAYGCFEGAADHRIECVQRSLVDGWQQATNNGCLRETAYYCIKVSDHIVNSNTDFVVKQLVLDHLVHSYNSIEDPNYLEYGYIKVYAEIANYLARRLPNQDLRVLYVGGGGYTLPRHIEATYPNAHQEVMEIDPGVTRTVYEKLGVDPARTRIVSYNFDGRLMLNQLLQSGAGQYDLVIGDAFNDLSIPYHLTTREFDQGIRRLLKDDGFYLALVIDKLRGGRFMPAYTRTVMDVWPATQILADSEHWLSTSASTYVVAAGNQPIDPARLAQVHGQGGDGRVVTRIMPGQMMREWLTEANPPILTDDYAPVDNLIAPVFAERGF
ncbi:MAG: fused MFS/spermidine synthase, partial [Chloroflexota bacterium]|nr:fused MFS/spermidine synthase [Chloroflexota bacterium]